MLSPHVRVLVSSKIRVNVVQNLEMKKMGKHFYGEHARRRWEVFCRNLLLPTNQNDIFGRLTGQ